MVRTVYVVDADASVREGLARVVESAGFEARQWPSVPAFVRGPVDARALCALVDLSDRSLRAAQVREQLALLTAVLPVIALSAADDPYTQRLAREIGVRAFFHKPVDANALLDSIHWVTRAPK